jgi:hypothetical protein
MRAVKRTRLKELLFKETQCRIQADGWPCNTCFHSMDLGISDDKLHELWRSTLLIRGDYENGEFFTQDEETFDKNIDQLIALLSAETESSVEVS